MNFQLLRVYYRAAVIVPFYTACFFVGLALLPLFLSGHVSFAEATENYFVEAVLQDVLYSGIIGVLTASCFLNCIPTIAYHSVYRLLAWMLLPYSFIAYLLGVQVDWSVMNDAGSGPMLATTFLLLFCFLHVIGIIISFMDFRVTMMRFEAEEERNMNLANPFEREKGRL